MRKTPLYFLFIAFSIYLNPLYAQKNTAPDSLGLPGDNLNLYGVLNLFQKSETLESFEKKINTENSKVNNLDLNGDDKTDYIKVVDNVNGSAHAIVLQVAISETEIQDVAVIEVEKNKDDQIIIQIIGDEELYGKNYIVEPNDDKPTEGTPNPGYKKEGNTTTINNYNTNPPVASWVIVGYMYQPTYRVYVSPYRWGYYPSYWYSWRPMRYHAYYGYHRPHYNYYRRTYSYRAPAAHVYYGPRRTTSVTVINKRQSGAYRSTYTRTAKQGAPRQNQTTQPTNRVRTNNSNTRQENTRQPSQKTPTEKRVGRTNVPEKRADRSNSAPQKRSNNGGGGGGGARGRKR